MSLEIFTEQKQKHVFVPAPIFHRLTFENFFFSVQTEDYKENSVCLHPFFPSMGCPVTLKLHKNIKNCHRQRLTKPCVSFTHCLCPFCVKILCNNVDLLLLLPVESMNENTDSATLPLQPTFWWKVGLHLYCSLLGEPLHSVGMHVIELYNPAMTEKRRGHLSMALLTVLLY